jgi:hypothetical protein
MFRNPSALLDRLALTSAEEHVKLTAVAQAAAPLAQRNGRTGADSSKRSAAHAANDSQRRVPSLRTYSGENRSSAPNPRSSAATPNGPPATPDQDSWANSGETRAVMGRCK